MEKEIKSYDVDLYRANVWFGLKKEWAWRVKASNGRIIGSSQPETYKNKSDAIYNIKSLGLSLSNFKDEE